MIYFLAIILSFIACIQVFVSEIVVGNIFHRKQGPKPNAGAALFPVIPFFQFLALGLAWLLEKIVPNIGI
jgi:hypothetical protein